MSSAPPPQPLSAQPLSLTDSEFRAVQGWPFPDDPFYVRQVQRTLLHGIPHLVLRQNCAIWGYSDRQTRTGLVGFSTLRVATDYAAYSAGLPHCYIPVLSVNPGVRSLGYGQSIVEHLVAEAATVFSRSNPGTLSNLLFLDVYTANQRAINLYDRCGFTVLNPDTPIPDPDEANEPYFVMARNIAVPGTAQTSQPPVTGTA